MNRLPGAFVRRLQGAWRRWSLWALLATLLLLLLGTLVWLAGRYEMSQLQSRLESDATAAVFGIRGELTRNAQSLQALHASGVTPEASKAAKGSTTGGKAASTARAEAMAALKGARLLLVRSLHEAIAVAPARLVPLAHRLLLLKPRS